MASSETCIHDEQRARLQRATTDYGLIWEDLPKEMQQRLINEVPVFVSDQSAFVKAQVREEVQHVLIEGDNLHALHTLQATHKGKIDVIYIDPPYNTGKEFIYNDKLIDSENTYRHSAWLSFMEKRLRLAKLLLSETGLILVSIDDNEQHRLHMLMDQIFGESNFMATFSWQNADTLKNDAKWISPNCEALLLFARDKSKLTKFRGVQKGEKQRAVYKNKDNDPRGPYLLTPLHAKSGSVSGTYEVTFSNGQTWSPPQGTFHRFSKTTLESLDSDNRLYLDVAMKRAPQRKTFLSEVSERMPLWTFLRYEDFGSTRQSNAELARLVGRGKFQNPKPVKLISKILDSISGVNAVVLDFFAGSGTTLHAVAQLNAEDGGNRRCILVTNNENNICVEVTQPRVKAVLTGDWADGKHDSLPGALQFYRTSFIERKKNLDRMRSDLARHTVDLITIKEGVSPLSKVNDDLNILQGRSSTVVVVTSMDPNHEFALEQAKKSVRDGDALRAYVFTWSDSGVEDETKKLWPGWEVEPLPADMLSALRRLEPQRDDDLFADLQDGQ
jgi:adenine-specific DNA-methyltransferase